MEIKTIENKFAGQTLSDNKADLNSLLEFFNINRKSSGIKVPLKIKQAIYKTINKNRDKISQYSSGDCLCLCICGYCHCREPPVYERP